MAGKTLEEGGEKRRRNSSSNASTSTSNLNTISTAHHLQLFNSGSFFSGTGLRP